MITEREVGERLRMARLAQRRSQRDVAQVIGIHQTGLAHVERGTRKLMLLEAVALCESLELPLERLVAP